MTRTCDHLGKYLAARLEVPLPYLLYRAQTRYEQDLRGLQDIRGALNPSGPQAESTNSEGISHALGRPSVLRRQSHLGGSAPQPSSARLSTPLGVRARLNSLGTNSAARLAKTSSSSVLTLQGHRRESGTFRPSSPLSSGSEEEEDEVEQKKEEAERLQGEQEEMEKKLKALQLMMTDEKLGLVSSPRTKRAEKGKLVDRGRVGNPSVTPPRRSFIKERDRQDALSSSASRQSLSSASPQGSIPSMPSPPPDPQSPMSRHLSSKSRSPPSVSARNARGHSHRRYTELAMTGRPSDRESNQGSTASSFSDLSGQFCPCGHICFRSHYACIQMLAYPRPLLKVRSTPIRVAVDRDCKSKQL